MHEIQADEAQNEQVSFGGMVGDSVTEATENTKTNKKKCKFPCHLLTTFETRIDISAVTNSTAQWF